MNDKKAAWNAEKAAFTTRLHVVNNLHAKDKMYHYMFM
jgi:hypothetical protein